MTGDDVVWLGLLVSGGLGYLIWPEIHGVGGGNVRARYRGRHRMRGLGVW